VQRKAVSPEVIVSTASAAFPVKTKSPPWNIIPAAFQNMAPFSSAKEMSSFAWILAAA
jgi:hypothetical protein